ncbi:DUF937 domain-containing protein [Propioniciclava soli]|uniref:DUF937 domain-containing protein n=1 Tax=Propioniciclava soli TaxID=2775081 RepID=UPI001E2F68B1|nr:DUF937 domain-containing protein [Propioniciclava soli]
MAAVDDIKANLDLDQVAQYLGTDRAEADRVVDQALASLVGQLDHNVADADGAVGLTRALDRHADSPAFSDRIDLAGIDTGDGAKIVDHVYAPDQIQALGGGQGGSLVQRLLPILAPIVLSYLAKRLGGAVGGGGGLGGALGGGTGTSRGGLGGILEDLLGGAAAQQSGRAEAPANGGGIGDILGDLLGGGRQQGTPGATPQASGGAGGGGVGTGPFTSQTPPPTDLTLEPGTASSPAGSVAPEGTAVNRTDNPLGGILSDLLFGRR